MRKERKKKQGKNNIKQVKYIFKTKQQSYSKKLTNYELGLAHKSNFGLANVTFWLQDNTD